MVESGFDDRPDVTAGLAAHQFFRGICTGALCMQHRVAGGKPKMRR